MLSTSSSLASPRKFRQDSSSSSVSGSDSNRSNSSSSSAGKKKKSNLLSSLRKESSSCSKLHSQKADLARLLEKRPTPVELEEKNILVDATIPTQSVPRARTGCWSLSFEKLLECETGVDFLRIFLASEQQLPCLYFLEAVKKYEQVSTPDLFRNAKHIVNTFILWDDVNTVPISERTKAEINEKYSKALSNAEIPPDFRWLFSAAKKEIVEHMDKTIYPAFLKSSAYQAGMKGHDESSNSSWRTLHSPRGKAPQPPKPTKVQKPSMDPQTRMSIFPVSLSALSKRTFNNPSPASQSTGSMPIPQASKNVCTVDEVLSWAQNLRALISSKAGLETFRAFLISEHSIENLDFYQEIFVFRKGNVEERNVLFEHLYRTYVMQKASLQVNLSGSVRSEMNDWIEKNPLDDNMERVVPLTIFDRAQAEIFDLIESDSYKRFIKSSFFQDALKNAQQEVSSAPSTSLAQSATPLTLTTLTQPAPPSSIPTTQKPEKSAESDASKSLKKMMPVESSCLSRSGSCSPLGGSVAESSHPTNPIALPGMKASHDNDSFRALRSTTSDILPTPHIQQVKLRSTLRGAEIRTPRGTEQDAASLSDSTNSTSEPIQPEPPAPPLRSRNAPIPPPRDPRSLTSSALSGFESPLQSPR